MNQASQQSITPVTPLPGAQKPQPSDGLTAKQITFGIIGFFSLLSILFAFKIAADVADSKALPKYVSEADKVALLPKATPVEMRKSEKPNAISRSADSAPASRTHVEEFNSSLSAPAIRAYMGSAALSSHSADDLEVTVTSRWHYEPKAIRLQMAQVIWKAWAGIHSPQEPDKAYLTLRDASGNKVGGSRVAGGSFIWVQD